MIEKFPFDGKILQNLGILVPEKLSSYSVDRVIRLAKNFAQLEQSN